MFPIYKLIFLFIPLQNTNTITAGHYSSSFITDLVLIFVHFISLRPSINFFALYIFKWTSISNPRKPKSNELSMLELFALGWVNHSLLLFISHGMQRALEQLRRGTLNLAFL